MRLVLVSKGVTCLQTELQCKLNKDILPFTLRFMAAGAATFVLLTLLF